MIPYFIMRLVRKDPNHIFIDLWNEHYQSNIEFTLGFTDRKKATQFYNYYKMRLDCMKETNFLEIQYFYEKIIKGE